MRLLQTFLQALIPALCIPSIVFNVLHRRMEAALDMSKAGSSAEPLKNAMTSLPSPGSVPKTSSPTAGNVAPKLSVLPWRSNSNDEIATASKFDNAGDDRPSAPIHQGQISTNFPTNPNTVGLLAKAKSVRTQFPHMRSKSPNEIVSGDSAGTSSETPGRNMAAVMNEEKLARTGPSSHTIPGEIITKSKLDRSKAGVFTFHDGEFSRRPDPLKSSNNAFLDNLAGIAQQKRVRFNAGAFHETKDGNIDQALVREPPEPLNNLKSLAGSTQKKLQRLNAGVFQENRDGDIARGRLEPPAIPESFAVLIREPEPLTKNTPKYNPMYLNPTAIKKSEAQLLKDSKAAEAELSTVGEILNNLAPDERLRGKVDTKFMIQEFRKNWLDQVPPESRRNPELLAEMRHVEERLSPLIKLSKDKVKLEKDILAVRKEWLTSLRGRSKGLQDAFDAYIKGIVDKELSTKIPQLFHNERWNRIAVRKQFEPMVDKLIENFDSRQLSQINEKIGFKPTRNFFKLNTNKIQFKERLLDTLVMPPDVKSSEAKFIFQELLKAHLAELTQPRIPEITYISKMYFEIINLKFRYHVIDSLNQAAEQVSKDYLKTLAGDVAKDTKLMKKWYTQEFSQLTDMDKKIEAQLFQKHFGIELSSSEIVEKLKGWGDMWNVDLQAFQKNFQNKLSYGDYEDLYAAASHSKSVYSQVLDGLKNKKEINSFKGIETNYLHGENNALFQKSVENLLERLKEKKILGAYEYNHLKTVGASEAFKVLRNKLQIDLFNELEIESIPRRLEVEPASVLSSISDFLSQMSKKGLLSPKEKEYLDPELVRESPIVAIEEFSRRFNQLNGLPDELKWRLAERDFKDIRRRDNFISETFINKKLILLKANRDLKIEELARESLRPEIYTNLQPQAIMNTIRRGMSNDDLAKELWEDYFQRRFMPVQLDNPPNPRPFQGMQLELLDQILSTLAQHGVPAPKSLDHEVLPLANVPDLGAFGKKVSRDLESLADVRNYILLHKPLRVGDARLEHTPFRFLSKDVIDEWNASVEYLAKKLPEISQNIYFKNLKTEKIQKELEALDHYNALVAEVLKEVRGRFSSTASGKLYQLNPEASNPRPQSL